MAHELPYIAAILEAIQLEMERDETVLYFGQNMATTENEPFVDAFGKDRVRVTPISETAEIGIAVGAALSGYRPVVELYMAEFMLVAMDQVLNEAPRFRGMSGGQVSVPIVLKAGYGFTAGWAGQHTGTLNALFMGVPGLKVAVPSTAADAKGLMATAIRDDNPVVYLHHYLLTLDHGEVPDGEYLVPFGEAAVRREGSDVTIVGTGWTVDRALGAAERLAGEGIQAEVIDPRTIAPLDMQTILESVDKTGHLVLVDQATRHASVSTVIAGEVAEHGFGSLKAPIVQVTGLDATIPYSEPLEAYVLPEGKDKLSDAQVLAERSDQVVSLIANSNALLAELETQSAALDQISGNISALSQQLQGFIAENRNTLRPALDKLNGVLTIVDNRKERVQRSIKLLGQYSNLAMIHHTAEEFTLNFIYVFPNVPQGKLVSSMIVSPGHAKRLLRALAENISRYETQFGPVKEAPEPQVPPNVGFIQ